ncbi:MAG: zinc ribbon domain-containing protein [Actinobacteria bacterium]|jgi:hypothetical protein|nr:MAG: zinc ribbon domain-containing protein [Actinomycetota bacterium]
MVETLLRFRVILPIVLLALLLSLPFQLALAQEFGEEGEYALQEEYRIEINDVGDAHITDTITYDPVWFEEYGYVFEENPNLLSRRYRADTNVGEVENFNADIDSGDATITISFDTPGLAYNLADGWTVFGYGNYELVDEGDDEVKLHAAWTITNEFSLFEPMSLEEEVVIVLPAGAQGTAFDATTGAIEYDIPVAMEGAGFLEDNKTTLIIIFALVMAGSLILLIYIFTRQTQVPAALAASPAQPSTAAPKFCKKCGHPRSTTGERFCRKCGATLE